MNQEGIQDFHNEQNHLSQWSSIILFITKSPETMSVLIICISSSNGVLHSFAAMKLICGFTSGKSGRLRLNSVIFSITLGCKEAHARKRLLSIFNQKSDKFLLAVATATYKYTWLALFNVSDSYFISTRTSKIQFYFLWNNLFHIYIIPYLHNSKELMQQLHC